VGFRPQKLDNEHRIPGWSHHYCHRIRNASVSRQRREPIGTLGINVARVGEHGSMAIPADAILPQIAQLKGPVANVTY